jgi:hypothetical protein
MFFIGNIYKKKFIQIKIIQKYIKKYFNVFFLRQTYPNSGRNAIYITTGAKC